MPTTQGTTQALLFRIQEGDEFAWGELEQRVRAWLKARFHDRLPVPLRGTYETEDLIQAGWLRSLPYLERFEPERASSLRHYLVRIISSELIDVCRSRLSRMYELERALEGQDASGAPFEESSASPEELLERAESLGHLLLAITELSPVERKILELRYAGEEELTFDDVGERIGLSASRVSRVHARIIDTLSRRMNRERVDD